MSSYTEDSLGDIGTPQPPTVTVASTQPKNRKDRFLLELSKILAKVNNLKPYSSFEAVVTKSYLMFSVINEILGVTLCVVISMVLFFVVGVGNWLTVGTFIVCLVVLVVFVVVSVLFRKLKISVFLSAYSIFILVTLEVLQFSYFKYPVVGTIMAIPSILCYSNLFAFNAKTKYIFFALFNILPLVHLIFFFFWILFSTEYSNGMTYTKSEMIYQLAMAHLVIGTIMFANGIPTGFMSYMHHKTAKVVMQFSENIDHLKLDAPLIKKLVDSNENVSFDVFNAFKRVILRLNDFKAFIPVSFLRPSSEIENRSEESSDSSDSGELSNTSCEDQDTDRFKFQVGSLVQMTKTIICVVFNTNVYESEVVPAFTRIFDVMGKVVNECSSGTIINIDDNCVYLMFDSTLTGIHFAKMFRQRFKEIFNDFDLLTWQQKLEIFSRLGIGISHGIIVREVVGTEDVKFEKYFGSVKCIAKVLAQFSLENECDTCIDSASSLLANIKDRYNCKKLDILIVPKTGKKILVESVSDVAKKLGDIYGEHRFIEMSKMKEMKKREIEIWDRFVSGDFDEMEKRIGDGEEKMFAKMLKCAENMKNNNMTIKDIEKATKKFKGGFVSLLRYLDLDVKKDNVEKEEQKHEKEEATVKEVIVSVK